MFPRPIIPKTCPRGLRERTGASVWQAWKSEAEERADVVHQFKFRNVARMRKMAKSATASEEAAALEGVKCHVESCRGGEDLLQYTMPLAARTSTSAQSNPAPAEAKILQDDGMRGTISLSHRPISPPVFQKGLKIAEKSPHRFSLNACMNSGRCRSCNEGRITVKSFEN